MPQPVVRLFLLQLPLVAIFVYNNGVVQLRLEIGTVFCNIFVPQLLLLRFFLRGQALCLGFSGERIDAADFLLIHTWIPSDFCFCFGFIISFSAISGKYGCTDA